MRLKLSQIAASLVILGIVIFGCTKPNYVVDLTKIEEQKVELRAVYFPANTIDGVSSDTLVIFIPVGVAKINKEQLYLDKRGAQEKIVIVF